MSVLVGLVLNIRTVTENKFNSMVYKGIICLFTLLVSVHQLSAQQQQKTVVENRDSLIGLLQEYRAYYNLNPVKATPIRLAPKVIDKSTASRVKVRGFRVQIFSGSSRTEATKVQNAFIRSHADVNAYLDYVEPNYRVKVGDFTSRSAATAYMRELRGKYQNVFVFVEDVWTWR